MSHFRFFILAFFCAVPLSSSTAAACSSCGCSFNSDWASQEYSRSAGFKFDLRYDYISQNHLRKNSSGVSKQDFSLPNEEEIQQSTITRETLFGFEYDPDQFWGVRAVLPYLDRTHSTVAPGDTETSASRTNGIGDIQLIGHYQGFLPLANLGVQFGVKLPTGEFRDNFSRGAQAGEPLDRGLQNGTGTTDAILGIYNYGVILPGELEYFGQVIADQPLDERADFRPGTSVTVSTGLMYTLSSIIKPQMQVNYHFEDQESGGNSDHDNSGSNSIYLTPGVSFLVLENTTLYSLVQVPIYQQVNGLQLREHEILSFGVRTAF